jgi:hypothetical protein
MSSKTLRAATYRALIVLSVFSGLSAVGGGIGMMVADGLSMPKSFLADSPFSTYLIPGLILCVAVGGPQVRRLLSSSPSANQRCCGQRWRDSAC